MRIGTIPIGPRRATALGGLASGVIAVALILLGAPPGPVAVGALGAVLLLAVAMVFAELRRLQRTTAAGERAATERWQQLQEASQRRQQETRALVRELRESVETRLAAAEQLQQRAFSVDLVHRAAQRRRDGGPDWPGATREEEISLIRGSTVFDAEWYLAQVGSPVADPVAHYVDHGAELGIDPHPLFPATSYLHAHPEALELWRTPLAHFLGPGGAARDLAAPAGGLAGTARHLERTAGVAARWDHRRTEHPDLKWEYLARGLHHERDTFVLYRIIGNDLPPRHRLGQGLDNLRFVLEHEPELPGCEKRWVVNRIVDPRIEKQIISLLEEHGMAYLHIPFRPEEYRRVGWRFTELEPAGLTYRSEFAQFPPGQQQRVLDHVYHYKNLYVMNNNGARNAALRQGRSLAKWVLPWDGNCFLTRSAWDELVEAVAQRPHLKYFTVPMARVVDNATLLRPGPRVEATEEPQLLFRRDAREEFNPTARYGRRPKVELFYRLRIPGPWDNWGRVPWDDPLPPPSPEAGQTGEAGWVARLFSGEPAAEADSQDRQWRRISAIRDCIDRIDQELVGELHDSARPFSYEESVLERQRARYASGEPGPQRVVTELVSAAGRSRTPDRLPDLLDAVTVKVLAGYFTAEARFAQAGAELVRDRLVGRRGRIPPDRDPKFSIVDGWGIGAALDAVRLLTRERAFTGDDTERLRGWLGNYRRWLVESEPGRDERAAPDHRGTWYDVQLLEIDAYRGDLAGLLETLRRAHERLEQQFGPGGSQPAEREPASEVLNLLGWSRLAHAARRVGQDLWSQRLEDAVRRLLSRRPDPDRCAVLAHAAAAWPDSSGLVDLLETSHRDPWQLRQVFAPGAGVRPFWVLGSEVEPK